VAAIKIDLTQGRAAWIDGLLPLCALGMIAFLLLQNEGVMEARFREPLDAIVVCAALLVSSRRSGTAR